MLPCANAKAGFSPRVINEPASWHTVVTMVAAGIGVSLAPSCVRSFQQPGVTLIPIQRNPPPLGLVASYPKGEPSPAVAAFLDLLRQQLPQLRGKYA